jgi:hypothetical protein
LEKTWITQYSASYKFMNINIVQLMNLSYFPGKSYWYDIILMWCIFYCKLVYGISHDIYTPLTKNNNNYKLDSENCVTNNNMPWQCRNYPKLWTLHQMNIILVHASALILFFFFLQERLILQ